MRIITARSGGNWGLAVPQCSKKRIDFQISAHPKDLNGKEKQ